MSDKERKEFETVLSLIEKAFHEGFVAPESYNDKVSNSAEDEWRKSKGHYEVALRAAIAQQAVPEGVDLPDVDEMAHSACQEALSFGVSHEVFHRWMRAVMDKTVASLAQQADNWRQYATEREDTAQQVIERHRAEHGSLLRLLAKDRATIAELRAQQAGQAPAEGDGDRPTYLLRLIDDLRRPLESMAASDLMDLHKRAADMLALRYALAAKHQPKGTPAGYVTAIDEGKALMLPRPSLDTTGLVAVYTAAQATAPGAEPVARVTEFVGAVRIEAECLPHTGAPMKIGDMLYAAPGQVPAPAPVEMSPEFTDSARAALLWVLWHHQGGSSPVVQPIRFALGMGAHDHLNEHQIGEAKRWAGVTGWTTERVQKYHPSTAAPADQSPAVGDGDAAAWEYRALYVPNPQLDDGMRVTREKRVAEVNGQPGTIVPLHRASKPPVQHKGEQP